MGMTTAPPAQQWRSGAARIIASIARLSCHNTAVHHLRLWCTPTHLRLPLAFISLHSCPSTHARAGCDRAQTASRDGNLNAGKVPGAITPPRSSPRSHDGDSHGQGKGVGRAAGGGSLGRLGGREEGTTGRSVSFSSEMRVELVFFFVFVET